VRDKLENLDDWEAMQRQQSLHVLIQKIECICIGFDDHKQEVFNLVQSLKTLFLFTQGKNERVEEYLWNLRSLWDTVEAFGGSTGVHKGLTEGLIKASRWVADPNNITEDKLPAVKAEASAIKVAILISGVDRRRYRKLKDKLTNSYLLGSDQYPDTFHKAMRILGNYQTTSRPALPYKLSRNNTREWHSFNEGVEAAEEIAVHEARAERRWRAVDQRQVGTTTSAR
jgi:hypothetical protein